MTALRLISFPVHGALEMALGMLVMVAPFLFGFDAGVTLAALAIGVVMVGLAFTTVDSGGMSIAGHFAFDYGIALGLLATAVVVGVADAGPASLLFLAAGVAHLGLNATTRYSAPR